MVSIRLEVKDFGDEDENNCKTDEINKENMDEFSIFITEYKSKNATHTIKYDKQTLCKFCRKKNVKREVKHVLYSR